MSSMELRLHAAISDPVHLEFEHQASTCYPHIKCEVQIIELHAFSRCQTREQTLWHCVKISRERAYIDESFAERVWRNFSVASDEVVLDDERLTRAKVTCVVE